MGELSASPEQSKPVHNTFDTRAHIVWYVAKLVMRFEDCDDVAGRKKVA